MLHFRERLNRERIPNKESGNAPGQTFSKVRGKALSLKSLKSLKATTKSGLVARLLRMSLVTYVNTPTAITLMINTVD